jgi:sarcosine oxidase
MDRRTLLKGLGTAVASAAAATAPALTRGLPDVTVVGAGAFGAWTALCLRERGANVLLLDCYGAGNALQTSGDETRQIRAAYSDQEIYTRWATRAFTRWHERQEEVQAAVDLCQWSALTQRAATAVRGRTAHLQ